MPNRIIRESCRTSPTLAQLSADAERLFWRLTTTADDFGRFDANPDVVRGQCFPLLLSYYSRSSVVKCLHLLSSVNIIQLYTIKDHTYGVFVEWSKHQRPRAAHSKYPAPAVDNNCLQALSNTAVVVFENRVSSSETTTKHDQQRFLPPTPAEATAYALTLPRPFILDGQRFCDYYESKGWVIGKTAMKSWQAAVRTWQANAQPKVIHASRLTPATRAQLERNHAQRQPVEVA